MRCEAAPELLARTVESDAHRARCRVERRGDLVARQTVDVMEEDGVALSGRQQPDSLPYVFERLSVGHGARRSCGRKHAGLGRRAWPWSRDSTAPPVPAGRLPGSQSMLVPSRLPAGEP